MSALVDFHVEGSVARLTLNSPQNRNALSTALVDQLHQGLTEATEHGGVRTVVLGHTGGTFCAGADLGAFARGDGNRLARVGDGPLGPTRMLLS